MTDRQTPRDLSDVELDTLIRAAWETAPAPSDALTARILRDADAALPRPVPDRRRGWFGRVVDGVGGWPAAAGLAAATLAGVGIGLVTPESLESLSNGYLSVGTDAADFLPSYAVLLGEG